MYTLPNFQTTSNSKARLQSSTALATLLLVTTLITTGGSVSAQPRDLTIDTDESTNWNLNTNNWDDGSGGPLVDFDQGDRAIFTGTGVTVLLQQDIAPTAMTFNPASGSFTIQRESGGDQIFVPNNANLAIETVTGETILRADVLQEAGIVDPNNRPVLTLNLDPTSTGTLSMFEDFDGGVELEVYGGTLNLLADADREASTQGALRIFGGTVNNNAFDGTGVNNDATNISGGLSIRNGILNNNVGGNIRQTARVRDGGTLNARGGTFEEGILVRGPGANANINENTTINNGFFADVLEGTLTVTDTNTLTGDVRIAGGTVVNNETINGTIFMDQDIDQSGTDEGPGGELTNDAGSNITGRVTLNDGIINADGGSFDDDIDARGGQINVNVNQDLQLLNDTNNGSDIDVIAGVTLQGDFTNETGSLSVAATGIVEEEVVLNGGTVNANGGTFNSGFDLNGGTLNVNDVLATSVINDDETSIVITDGGDMQGTIMNTGADASVTVETNGDASALVTLDEGTVTADGGTFTGGLDLNAGALEVTGDLVTVGAPGAAVANDAATVINIRDGGTTTVAIDNSGADAEINNFTDGAVAGVITMTDGTLNARGGTFAADSVVFQGGEVNIEAATTLTVDNESSEINVNAELTSDVLNNGADGTLTNNNNIIGTVTNDGGRFEQTNGSVSGIVDLDSGRLVASGGTFTSGLDADGGSVGVTGTFTSAVDANNTDIAIAQSGSLVGDLTFDATTLDDADLDIRGDLTGNLIVDGGVTDISGEILEVSPGAGGTLTQNGGLVRIFDTGRVNGAVQVDDGAFLARGGLLDDGATVTAGGRIVVDSSATQSGELTAALDNEGGRIFIRDGARVLGELNNTSGNTSLRGVIQGDLNVTDGQVTARGEAGVTMDTEVSGDGTLVLTSGVYGGDVLASAGGMLETRGSLEANIVNDGGMLDLDGSIDGSVTNDAGNAISTADILETLNVTGGSYTQLDGSVEGLTTVSGGDLLATEGNFAGGILGTNGNITFDDDVSTSLLDNRGADVRVLVDTTLGGVVEHLSGSLEVIGAIAGTLEVSGEGALVRETGGIAEETTVLDGGRLVADGGTFAGDIQNDGGRVIVAGDVVGSIDNDDGRLVIIGSATLDGNVTNADRVTQNGAVGGTVTNNNGGEYNLGTDVAVGGDGLINNEGGTVNFDGTMLSGSLFNFGDINNTGESFITGNSVNDGTINIESGTLTFLGQFENNSPNTLDIESGATFEAALTENAADGRITNAGTLIGDVINDGLIESNDGLFNGVVTNNAAGLITVLDGASANFAGGLRNSGTVDLTGDGNVGNSMRVGGEGLSGRGEYTIDIDLGNTAGGLGQSDFIIAEAGTAITGNLLFTFNITDVGGQQLEDIPVLVFADADTADAATVASRNFTFSPTSLTDTGDEVLYFLEQDGTTKELFVRDIVNPSVGALAGSVVLTQSLIGSVINRPSSPFVNGLAYEDENPCGAGGWARAIGGQADATGAITQLEDGGSLTFESEISADYYGIQVGGDYACFNGFYNGWDLAVGGIAGLNQGSSSQPIFGIDTSSGRATDTLIATTNVDFDQTYAGIYGTASKDRFAAELQYRVEQTDFTATNDASGSLQLTDAEFGSDSSTISGSFSYALSVPNTELTFVPIAGFAYTDISPENIEFDDGGVVRIDNFTSEVVFVGGSLSRASFGEDGTTALNQFVTATYYNELADDPVSEYTPSDTDGTDVLQVTTENLGSYAEISAGLNYVKILDVGNPVNAKQLSASARADLRVGDQIESWGLTAQVRIQF